jgi:ParB-like chromosome segregation protein Spo0J
MEIFKCSYNEIRPVDELMMLANPKNPNTHPPDQIEALAKIIKFQGQRSPIVISKRSGFIIKGHARLMAINKLGWKHAAVDVQEYKTEAEEYADMVADNEIAKRAVLDVEKLFEDLKNVDLGDFELLGLKDFNPLVDFNLGQALEEAGLSDEDVAAGVKKGLVVEFDSLEEYEEAAALLKKYKKQKGSAGKLLLGALRSEVG